MMGLHLLSAQLRKAGTTACELVGTVFFYLNISEVDKC